MIACLIVVVLAVLLAGCAAGAPQRVNVPVPVECRVQTPARPAMPLDALPASYSVDVWIAHAIAETVIRESYENELIAALRVCLGIKYP
ncbi:hypothetical protein [uncultured Xylophilus sp.]|uniref:hypothetical protein n=1 Tax=uncultured Xylophilus sp. TaxID=296832 RepID=UPI0025D3E176|nr:hypothetical protein [uncultured Xylophilus sp.]